jgi:hypothetical protein
MIRWAGLLVGGLMVASLAEGGCIVQDEAARYREGIPQGGEVALGVPRGGGGTSGQAQTTLRIQNNPSGGPTNTPPGGYAQFYALTRDFADGVDLVTGFTLGVVWLIVNQQPTSVDGHHAVWGPGQGDALDPVVWRFVATEVGDHEYDYQLDARPKGSSLESDYRAVLMGHGFGKERAEHRTGWFLFDNDAHNALDPLRASGTGTVKVTFDLRSLPATIAVEIKPNDGTGAWMNLGVTHAQAGAGEVDIKGLFDVESVKDGKLETVSMKSRWQSDGAGRADVLITGGDVPASISMVQASECWSTSFARSYYGDNVGYEPTTGDPAACVFTQAQF